LRINQRFRGLSGFDLPDIPREPVRQSLTLDD
jgi:hypothetical protein